MINKKANRQLQLATSFSTTLLNYLLIRQLARLALAARLISLSNRILQTLLYLALLQISATVHMVFLPGLGHINNRRPIGRTHRQRRIKRHNEYQRKDYSTKLPCSIHLNHLRVASTQHYRRKLLYKCERELWYHSKQPAPLAGLPELHIPLASRARRNFNLFSTIPYF